MVERGTKVCKGVKCYLGWDLQIGGGGGVKGEREMLEGEGTKVERGRRVREGRALQK